MITIAPENNQWRDKIAPNFYGYELDCRSGVSVPIALREGAQAFIQYVQQIRDFWGRPVTIISGYRTRAYNTALREASLKRNGGFTGVAENSIHIYDEADGHYAVDIRVAGVTPRQVADSILGLIRLELIPDGGVGLYQEEGWVHYDDADRRRWGF